MKNIKFALCIGLVLSCFAFSANAGVQFLPNVNGVGQKKSAATTSEQKCKNAGYKYTSCGNDSKATNECPYKKGYFKTCCPKGYVFTKKECSNRGLKYSSDSCGGLYKCI